MKIEAYDENSKQERTILLKLIPNERCKGLTLTVVDGDGKVIPGGHVATINAAGQLVVHGDLNPSTGLHIDGLETSCPRRIRIVLD